jgi:hypothetical protein
MWLVPNSHPRKHCELIQHLSPMVVEPPPLDHIKGGTQKLPQTCHQDTCCMPQDCQPLTRTCPWTELSQHGPLAWQSPLKTAVWILTWRLCALAFLNVSCSFLVLLLAPAFELRASHLLGRHSTSPLFFETGSLCVSQAGLELVIFLCQPPSARIRVVKLIPETRHQ